MYRTREREGESDGVKEEREREKIGIGERPQSHSGRCLSSECREVGKGELREKEERGKV